MIDLRGRDWSQGPVVLSGSWFFNGQERIVPDTWSANEAGGEDGRGWGTYRLTLLVDASLPLALRYGTASTALRIRESGRDLVQVGLPSADADLAMSAYAPGTVRLPQASEVHLEIFVSNHDYRVGGLWLAPTVGPALTLERGQWTEEAGSLALAAALTVIGVSTLLLFGYRRSNRTFLHLGLFSLLVALRSLVTGEYALVKLLPDLPFDWLIRLEYWTAYLPLPSATLFFAALYPGMLSRLAVRLMAWPSWAFAISALILPLDLMTRCIPWFYPVAVPALLYGSFLLVRRIVRERQGVLFLLGVALLATTGLADMATAALFATTGTSIPWGLGLFAVLQATALAQGFLRAFQANEALLAQKELLVREVHHRVKNSLQVVASLVSLQANRTPDPQQKSVFRALRQRITAIALVHEKLYGQGISGQPDVGAYLTELLRLQYPGDGLGSGRVVWEVHADPLAAGVDYCIDAGLILTELVANAHKHGLSAQGGKLEVSIRIREGRLAIEVTDSGPGFPEGFRAEDSEGLGFRLVLALLQRNDGRLELGPGGRACVDLRLPSAAD